MINEKVLEALDFPEGKLLAHYFNVVKLRGQLADGKNAWMKMVGSGDRIRGRVNTLGAVSRRCTHSNPNMAQVPSPRSYMGKEARQLFTVPRGKKLVGADLSGLELRVFAHYLARYDGGAYADVILNGDIHTYNQKAAGLETRDMAKTFIYGVLYGAGDAKVGEIVGGTAEAGRQLKERFFRSVPAYKRLLDAVGTAYKQNGFLKALDGNPYHIRSAHSALNTLLQGAGALIAKQWVIEIDKELNRKYANRYEFILQVHDEVELEVDADIAEDVARICEASSLKAGEILKIRMPVHSEGKVGDTWYDVH
jgi:DNA polymerase I-like protein with 3'-5' exonuclease and polymerase domains